MSIHHPHARVEARTGNNRAAREAALQALGALPAFVGQGVEYHAAGHLLIIGSVAQAFQVSTRLGTAVSCSVVLVDEALDSGLPAEVPVFGGNLTRLEGYLGRFKAYLLGKGGDEEIDLAPLTGRQYFDAVLDLGDKPMLKADLPPPGYFAPCAAQGLEAALQQLQDLVGEFEKPRYVQINSDLCAHSASGLLGCTRCLNVCPAWAIHPDGEKVTVDVHLCHGVGSCASACPSGAISYNYPDRKTLINRVRTLMQGFLAAGGEGAALLIHDNANAERISAALDRMPGRVVPLELEEIGAAGIELWLSALAYGAAEVLLLTSVETPGGVLRVLDSELEVIESLLAGMGCGSHAVRRIEWEALMAATDSSPAAGRQPARFAALEDKREVIRLSVDHLYQQTARRQMVATLPEGAAFGAVTVADGCTLCMACASVCPPGALQGGTQSPQLQFLEQNCVQCGLCVKACPEQVVTLQPRYLFDDDQRRTARILRADEAVCCTDCGTPFAPCSSITKLQHLLAGHRMFAGAAARRFELCDSCRVKDIMRETGQA